MEPQEFVHLSKTCTKCGSINNCKYRYLNNGKKDQPRYQCLACKAFFSHILHGRSKCKKYLKPRGMDPPELLGIVKTCTKCNELNNARFLYYNNKSRSQPRFQCLECQQQFQFRLNMQALLRSDQRDDTPKHADMKLKVTGEHNNALNRVGSDNQTLADEVRNPPLAEETSNAAQAGKLDIPSKIEEDGNPVQQTDDSGIPMHIDEAYDPDLNGLQEEEFEEFISSLLLENEESVQAEEGAAPPAPIEDHAEGG